MDIIDNLTPRLRERLDAVEAERRAQAASVEATMRERLESEARLSAETEPIRRCIVAPLVGILANHFDNAAVEHLELPRGFVERCRFARTPRFPATAALSIGLEWDVDGHHAWLVATREILPVLMPFDGTDRLQVSLPVPDEAPIRVWVEDRILAFVDACLRVEGGPEYQFGRLHTDPVCGMSVPAGSSDHTADVEGTTYYFCSAACRSRFVADPGRLRG